MNIKGILRSTAAKIIAFAGIVGCFAAAVFIGENAIAGCGRDGMIYQFETDFSQSSYMAGQVNNTAVTLEAALEGGISTGVRAADPGFSGQLLRRHERKGDFERRTQRQRNTERGVLPDCPAGRRDAEQYFVVLYAIWR